MIVSKFIKSDSIVLGEIKLGVDRAIFTPVKSKRTFEEVSAKIKDLIFEGTLKTGDRLPSESELAVQFGVGRQTVREALRILELSGFITVQKGYGGGPIVKDTVVSKISILFQDAFQLEKISLEHITQARSTIESAILTHIVENIDDRDIKALQEKRGASSICKQGSSIFPGLSCMLALAARSWIRLWTP